jgi:hypothetical protein
MSPGDHDRELSSADDLLSDLHRDPDRDRVRIGFITDAYPPFRLAR